MNLFYFIHSIIMHICVTAHLFNCYLKFSLIYLLLYFYFVDEFSFIYFHFYFFVLLFLHMFVKTITLFS